MWKIKCLFRNAKSLKMRKKFSKLFFCIGRSKIKSTGNIVSKNAKCMYQNGKFKISWHRILQTRFAHLIWKSSSVICSLIKSGTWSVFLDTYYRILKFPEANGQKIINFWNISRIHTRTYIFCGCNPFENTSKLLLIQFSIKFLNRAW